MTVRDGPESAADQRRRYRRHHFGAEFVTLAEGYAGSEAPNHSRHARLEHRRCFYDDDTDRRSAGVAKGQQEMRHSSPPAPVGLFPFGRERLVVGKISSRLAHRLRG
jgi:hypothetical protein